MKKKKIETTMELRQKAERLLNEAPEAAQDLTGMSPQDMTHLVHELRVHQIELKMQNDELRRIQTELEHARDRYVHLYDFSPAAYFTVSEKGAVTEANLTAAALLNHPRAALVGQMLSRFIHREDQNVWYLHRKRLLETGDFESFPLRLIESGGGEFHVNLECTLAENSDTETKVIRIAAADITELKRAEEALRQANAALEEQAFEMERRNAQLQKLVLELSNVEDRERRRIAMILHDDLQQRLVSQRYKIWGLLPGDEPGDEMDESLKEKFAEIDNDIALSIQVSRELSTNLSPPVLRQNGLLAALSWFIQDMKAKHGLSVTLDIDKKAEPETAELASILFRMVKELLFNIVKHAGVRSAHVDVGMDGGSIVIRVMDSGKGFDANGYQAGQETDERFGLFSIKERIGMLGGTVTVESRPGKGCRVVVSVPRGKPAFSETVGDLPVARADAASGADGRTAPAGEPGIRILIADDHRMMREGLAKLLKKRDGLEVVAQADNGRQAVALAKEVNPDLILMDVSMPEMDGIQAATHIHRAQPHICIVGLTACTTIS